MFMNMIILKITCTMKYTLMEKIYMIQDLKKEAVLKDIYFKLLKEINPNGFDVFSK